MSERNADRRPAGIGTPKPPAKHQPFDGRRNTMGTPKKKTVFFEKAFVSLTLGEKIKALEMGKQIGKKLEYVRLPEVLDEVVKIILPVVESFNKPLADEAMFASTVLPKNCQKRRGVHLFGSRFMDIWLLRDGLWFVCYHFPDKARHYQVADSMDLAEIILVEKEHFVKHSFQGRDFLYELPCLNDLAFYNAVFVHVLSEFFESVEKLIKNREEKLQVLRERVAILGEFGQSLDPLVSQGEKKLKFYEIWETTERGDYNRASSYFSSEAMKTLWEVIKKRHADWSGYRENISEYSFDSLSDLFQRIRWIVEEIERAKTVGKGDAESLWGYNSGRLPFSEEELVILKKFADSFRVIEK
jgi:hypothetical protein